MEYSITSFICTQLGNKQLNDATRTELLSDNELLVLDLITKAQNTDEKTQLDEIENKFASIYQQINLTGLVVLKLIEFNQYAPSHEELSSEDEINSEIEQTFDIDSITKDKDIEVIDIDLDFDFNIDSEVQIASGLPVMPFYIDNADSTDLTGVEPYLILASGIFDR